jgi:hypothetical protein
MSSSSASLACSQSSQLMLNIQPGKNETIVSHLQQNQAKMNAALIRVGLVQFARFLMLPGTQYLFVITAYDGDSASVFTLPTSATSSVKVTGFERFVITCGSAYRFLRSITGLRYRASIGTSVADSAVSASNYERCTRMGSCRPFCAWRRADVDT